MMLNSSFDMLSIGGGFLQNRAVSVRRYILQDVCFPDLFVCDILLLILYIAGAMARSSADFGGRI